MRNIIEDNINLAFSFAHNFNKQREWKTKYEYEEVISDCLLGLVKAAKNYDQSMGISFSTFAHICMKNEVLMSLRQKKKVYEHSFTLNLFDKDGESIDDITLIFSEINLTGEDDKVVDILSLKDSFGNLTEIEQKVIDLYYYHDIKINKIANILGFSESYISKIHGTAIKKLRKAIG